MVALIGAGPPISALVHGHVPQRQAGKFVTWQNMYNTLYDSNRARQSCECVKAHANVRRVPKRRTYPTKNSLFLSFRTVDPWGHQKISSPGSVVICCLNKSSASDHLMVFLWDGWHIFCEYWQGTCRPYPR